MEKTTATLTIERIVAGGYGLGRIDGRVVLVPLTVPGDVVTVEVPDRGTLASLISVVSAGADRIDPACEHYGECGGCDLMHLSYAAQLEAKATILTESITRLGGSDLLSGVTRIPISPNPAPMASRIRASWHPTPSGRAGYSKRRSHDILAIEHCPILDPVLEAARTSLQIRDVTNGLTNGREVSISSDWGSPQLVEFEVMGEHLVGSADVFFQAGTSLLDEFVSSIVDLVARGRPATVLELYSGIGLFTVPLARHVARIDAVEANKPAVNLAKTNLRRSRYTNVTCHATAAERWLPRRRSQGERWDAVLVDPPRSGMNRQILDALTDMNSPHLVYVSCDPSTFARDARRLADGGYALTYARGFDLFPQTHHVELVAAFEHR